MIKLFCFLLFWLAQSASSAPYVFFAGPHEYPAGDYGIIDSSDVVVSTGNILKELTEFGQSHPEAYFPESLGEIGDFLLDRTHDRIILFYGKPDEEYYGMAILRLSDRSYLKNLLLYTPWGHKEAYVNSAGKIYFNEYNPETNRDETHIYEASTYRPLHEAAKLSVNLLKACFFSKERLYANDFVKDENIINKDNFKIIKNMFVDGWMDGPCAGDKLIRGSENVTPYVLQVWDLDKSTMTHVIRPEVPFRTLLYQWVLSPTGDYLVYGDGIASMGYRAAALLEDPRIRVFDTNTGKETASAEIDKLISAPAGAKIFFMDFSVDGKSLVFYCAPALYVLDVKTLALQHKVVLPEAPEQVVW